MPKAEAKIEGKRVTWQPLTITLAGPEAAATDCAPNPFRDIRLQVVFTGPENRRYDVPGFFDGDGRGGSKGNVWLARFTPDVPGEWTYQAKFRQGPDVAIDLKPDAGTSIDLPNMNECVCRGAVRSAGSGLRKVGPAGYADNFYLKFAEGPYWIRGGTDEP